MFCSKCGTANVDGHKFCKKCGAELKQPRVFTQNNPVQSPMQGPVQNPSQAFQQPAMTPDHANANTFNPNVCQPEERPVRNNTQSDPNPKTGTQNFADEQLADKVNPIKAPVAEYPVLNEVHSGSGGKGALIGIICVLIVCGIYFGVAYKMSFWPFHSADTSDTETATQLSGEVQPEVAEAQDPEVAMECEQYDAAEDITPAEQFPSDIDIPLGFHEGLNSFKGNMIHTNGKRYPFTLSFRYNANTGEYDEIVYKNVQAGTKLTLHCEGMYGDEITFAGKDQGKRFAITFSHDGYRNYSGDAWWGDFHQNVELNLQ